MNKISKWIANIFFPEKEDEILTEKIISNIAKIQQNRGDENTIYSCPAYSFFKYRNPTVRHMIWRLKYRGNITVAEIFAKQMYDQLCEELTEISELLNFTNPILIPIPISKKKKRLRGFNQSIAICKALSQLDNESFFNFRDDVLYKIKDTRSQAKVKDRKSRLQNLKDSFLVKDISTVKNRNIILLDDVLTTGATLTEAANVLKYAGAKNIIWLVLAH